VLSVIISLNQRKIQKITKKKEKKILTIPFSCGKCKYIITLKTKDNTENAVKIGQGLAVTRWKGCCCFIVEVKYIFCIIFF